jgi:para-nitrobenzyl esterase
MLITLMSWVRRIHPAIILMLLLAPGIRTAGAQDICAAPVDTADGPVAGRLDPDAAACAYLGVPYAAPPVGELRLRAPAAPARHREVLAADEFKPWCPQKYELGILGMNRRQTETSEDCLYLNLWRPQKSGSYPVMFFIHGGGFTAGSGATGMYHGGRLSAQEEVVVVTINYRLGALGFLAHPALTAEDPHGSSGNYGVLDQLAALAWVRQNIAAFGGDPGNVTVFGESAGAWSVCNLLVSPLARGLFQRAIIHSGGCDTTKTLAQGYSDGEALARQLGCTADVPACLRAKTAAEILAAQTAGQKDSALAIKDMIKYTWITKEDGYVIGEPPIATMRQGGFNQVPLLIGSNRDELTIFTFNWFGIRLAPPAIARAVLREVFGADGAAEVERMYPFKDYRRPVDAVIDALGDAGLSCKCYETAQALAPATPVYYYRFDYDRHRAPHIYGAGHALELPFIFHTFDQPDFKLFFTRADTDAARDLSTAMMKYWANFARSGDPNGPGLPAWPPYTTDRPDRMYLDETPSLHPADNPAKCAFWRAHPFDLH